MLELRLYACEHKNQNPHGAYINKSTKRNQKVSHNLNVTLGVIIYQIHIYWVSVR